MFQIPDTRHRVSGRIGRIEAGANFFEATAADHLRESGIDLGGVGVQVPAVGEGGCNPAIGGVISARVAHYQGGLVFCRVVGCRAGGYVGLCEGDLFAGLVGVGSGAEDVQSLHAADDRQRMGGSLLNRGRKYARSTGLLRLWCHGRPGCHPQKARRAFYKRLRRAKEPRPCR